MSIVSVIKKVPKFVMCKSGRGLLMVKKFSPEILTGMGIVGGIASGIMACKATLKVEDVMDEHEASMVKINNTHQKCGIVYSDKDKQKDTVICYGKTVGKLAKLYAPPIALGVASIGCILGGHGILNKRNAAIAAAYSVVHDQLNDYRSRVVDEFGPDKDLELFHGTKTETITVTEEDENGKKKKVKKRVNKFVDPNKYSQYARFFDDASVCWVENPEYNLLFLKAQQNYANDLLHSRGHLFLNEVYDMLGIKRSNEGAVVGWVMSDEGDNFVDFGIYNVESQEAMDFVNGYNNTILLDFNVDGVIWNLI